jgi:AraC family transcriptional regulator
MSEAGDRPSVTSQAKEDLMHHRETWERYVSAWKTQSDAERDALCRTLFHGLESEKNNLGQKLPPLWADFLARRAAIPHADQSICYGVVRQAGPDTDELEYFAAVAVTNAAPPPGMQRVDLAASTYACFEHRGEATAVDRAVSYAYSTWLIQSGYQHTGGADLEIYDDRWHPTSPSSVLGYALPVRPS